MHVRDVVSLALIGAMCVGGAIALPRAGGAWPGLLVLPVTGALNLHLTRGLHAHVQGEPVVTRRVLPALRALPVALFAALQGVLVAGFLGVRLPLDRVAWGGTGVIFVGLAVAFAWLPRNPVVGIRTAHTVASERAWRSTHRVGAVTVAACGLLVALAGQVHAVAGLVALVAGGLANLVFVSIWSARAWASDPEREPL